MTKFLKKRTCLIIVLALLVIFNVIYWPVVSQVLDSRLAWNWLGYVFAMIGFGVAIGTTFLKLGHQNNTTSIVPVYVASLVYLVLNILINLIIILVNKDTYVLPIVLNVILLMIYAIALVLVLRSFTRVRENTEKREKRMFEWRTVEASVSQIIPLAEDAEIIKQLKQLREDIGCSSTASCEATAQADTELTNQISYLKTLVENGAAPEEISRAIKVTNAKLMARNQILMAARRS